MNKIFKVIWNKARNCYVVTSEIAKSHSKTKSETSKNRGYTLISTLAVLFLTGCVPVFAAVTDDPGPTDPNPARSAGIRLSSGWMSALEGGTATKMYDYGTPGNEAYDNTKVLQWDGTGQHQLYTGTHLYGIALGNAANAYDPEVQTASGTALGDYSRARSLAVAVGPYASAEKIAAVAIGAGAKAAEFNSLAMMRQSYASGKYAAAIGTAAVAKGEASLAMGHSSTATGNQSIAIGTIAPKTQYDSKGTPIAAYDGVNNTQATADRAIALGQTAHAKGVDSIAFGSRSTAGGASSIAYGTDAKACVDNAVAIGKSASAPTVNGVALGSNSRADRTSGEWGYNVKTEDGRTNGYAGLGGSALRSEYAAVSVGNEGHTRQITHVAAGSKDTDAVNVAQLRNVNLKVGANTGHTDVLLDSQTLKIQGDNQYVTTQAGSGTVTVGLTDAVRQKIDASANINLSNITNEGKTVIHNEAQRAVVVKGGSNTTVTSTVANGTKTYTVNGRDTTVSAVPGSRITVKDNGGIDANGNRHYEIGFKDCDLAKKTDIWTLQANGKDVPPSRGKVNLVNGENVTIEKSANGQIRISAKGGHDEDAVHYDISNGVVNKNSVTMAGSTYVNKTGGTHITNVAYATGNDGSEVVNVDYLTDQVNNAVTNTTTNVTNNLTAKGMNFVGNDGQVIHKNLGETLGIVGGGTKADSEYSTTNIKTVKDVNGNISVMMDKNLVTESVQVGKDGKDGKIGVSGKDGKDAVTVYGKDGVGHIGLTGPAGTNGKDGTNGIDLTVKNGYDDASKGIKGEKGVDGTDGITRIVYEDKTGEHQVATMEDGMVFGGDTGTDIIKKLNNKVSVIGGITNRTLLTTEDNIGVVSDGTDNLKVRLAKDLRGITSISNGDTKITLKDHCEDAVTITGGNINVTNNRITNLKDGEDEHDAVNKGQLDKAVDGIKQGAFGVTADDGKSVKKNLGETVGIGGDGTNISTSVENGKVRVSLNKDVRVDTVTANKVTTGDTTVTSDGLVINGGPSVTKNGIDAGNKVITNVAAGRIGAGSTDAVNGGQLHDMADSISRKGFGVTTDDGQSIMKGLGETVAIGGDGTNVRTSVSGGKVVVGLSDKLTIGSGAGAVSIDGVNGNIGVGGVSIGRQGGGSYVGGLSNTTWDVKNPNITSGRAATEDQLKVVSDKISGGRVFQGDWGKVSVGLGDTLNLRGNAKNLSRLTDGNIAVVSNSAQDGYNIKLAKDINMGDGTITFTTSTTAPESTPREMTNGPVLGEDRRPGAPTVTSSMTMGGSGITFTPVGTSTTGVRLTGTGLNNGGQQLHGVAAGTLDDDAVNVSQLRRVQVKVDNAGSASAALAGLHPLAYDPIAPTQVMAAVGSYGNSTSVALGLAHYTNENTLLHVGASFGQQDNAVNAGVTYKFGRSAEKKAIPDRYKAGPISSVYVMQDEVTALKAENARIKHHEEELTEAYRKVQADNEEMKAQIALLMEKAGLK